MEYKKDFDINNIKPIKQFFKIYIYILEGMKID